jgi:hypothetical protein
MVAIEDREMSTQPRDSSAAPVAEGVGVRGKKAAARDREAKATAAG